MTANGAITISRRALVTGASSGIGKAFAERLARDGFDLVVVARSQDRLESLADRCRREHGVEVEVLPADLAHPTALRDVANRIDRDDRLEILVNNAGFGTQGSFAALDPEREEEQVRLNVLALQRLTRAALPGMLARGSGSIVNVASLAGFLPTPYTATYGATKAFVIAFTEGIYEEVSGTGVRVQVLCPGFTRTEFQERAGIDPATIPSFAWMSAEAVVDSSLAALRSGEVIHVPGFSNRMASVLASFVPRAVLRRVSGSVVKRIG